MVVLLENDGFKFVTVSPYLCGHSTLYINSGIRGKSMLRYRATALIIRDGKVLLVKDKGRQDYSMPGGGFKHKESTIQAGIREVAEELRLRTIAAVRLRHCDLKGKRAHHKVVKLVVEGTPHIDRKELNGYTWWDTKRDIPVQGHVNYILTKYLGGIDR